MDGHDSNHTRRLSMPSRLINIFNALFAKVFPTGPKIIATMDSGFCGNHEIQVSRLPVNILSKSSWSILLGTLHNCTVKIVVKDSQLLANGKRWAQIPTQPLQSRDGKVGVTISRTTFINLLLVSNARPTYIYVDSSGYRAGFGSYIGQWYVTQRMNGPAVVVLHPHDSHKVSSDVYPPTFRARIDCCVQMMAGVVVLRSNPKAFSVGFPGRSQPGMWRLEYQHKGFPGSHGSRHIYNMNGGKVYEVDFLLMKQINEQEEMSSTGLQLRLPSLTNGQEVRLYVPEREQRLLAQALDFLPWSSLSWSIHRGLRDLLISFSKPIMDRYRQRLSTILSRAAVDHRSDLILMGWETGFVEEHIGDMAASAILAGRGNSGDLVRIVTCLAELMWDGKESKPDETIFWRSQMVNLGQDLELSPEAVVALVKCFVLEWSVEFDYQMYHNLPIEMLMV